MPITTNESSSAGSPVSSAGAEQGHAGAAAGLEIPVTVHASRYSAAATSVGKSLPPVHEETRTVIVFDQGAVVRLSATVSAGEVVVLTNQQTGADVICKVASVKAQPGIQNYVSLEFTQRAPGFWGESVQGDRALHSDAPPSVVATPSLVPPLATPALHQEFSGVETIQEESAHLALPEMTPATFEPEQVVSPLAEPTSSHPVVPARPLPSGKIAGGGSTLGLRESRVTPSNLRPAEFGSLSGRAAPERKNVPWIAIAAAILVAVGGSGGWLFLHHRQLVVPAVNQQASTPEAASEPPAGVAQAAEQPEKPAAPSLTLEEPETAVPSANSDAEAATVQPAAAKSASESMAAELPSAASLPTKVAAVVPAPQNPRGSTIAVGKMSAPSARTRAASMSIDAPPELLAQPNGLNGSALGENLIASSVRNSGPVAPAGGKGGVIQQPKLISAPQAEYPSIALSGRVQGNVMIDAFVDETGRVTATKAVDGPPLLQQAAMKAVRAWRYQPARLDGQPVSIHIRVTVSFQLQ